jgi:Uma2 family endonuclease
MAVAVQPVTYSGYEAFRKFSVAEYNRLIAEGVLDDEDKVELLEGMVVLKVPRDPRHDSTIQRIQSKLYRVIPADWDVRTQLAITLSESQPEPDFALVRGTADDYDSHHPFASEVGLAIEVANSSLRRDTLDKTRVYATDAVPEYWVIDVQNRVIEVYSAPDPAAAPPRYTAHRTVRPGDTLALALDGKPVATIPAADLLP